MEETLPLEKDLHESERNAFKFQVFPKTTVNTSNGLMDLSALCHLCKEATVANAVSHFRDTGEQQYKMSIPAFTPMGICTDQDNPKRSVRTMRPTELVMIDLDDVERSHDGLKAWVDGWIAQHREEIQQLKTTMVYITCSGKGVRVIFPRFEQLDILQSAQLYCQLTQLPSTCLDKQCVDISRLSILTTFDDIVYTHQPDTDDEGNVILNQATDQQLALFHLDKQDNTQATYSEAATSPNPFENKPFKEYTEKDIIENDLMYGDFKYKGRQVKDIVREYISWRTNGMGPEGGARHLLYNQLCKNFRNLCDNDPRILHAILPSMGHPTSETWKQAVYFCSLNSSSLVPRNFYFWLKERGYMEYPDKDEEEEDFTPQEEKFYAWALKNMPPLPPIMKEIVNNAPYWFKLPILSVMESYLSLICTNYRSHYIDGFPVSLSSYNIIYAPQGSGKSMSRRVAFLIEEENKRDKLALMKAQQYDSEVRKANGSSENPEEPKWKQRLFAARTSLGEIMKRQEAIGNHHWLQDVSEFSIWAATIKKNKEEWSAFFRTSYDNEEFSQSFQSSNSYRGRHQVFPILNARCTPFQFHEFFTDLEDGLLTRFDFMPLLGQRFADYQPWKPLSAIAKSNIDKTLKRLRSEAYVNEVTDKDPDDITYKDLEDPRVWDYQMKEPFNIDLDFLFEPLHQWLLNKLNEAIKDNNSSLDTFRRRCARKGFQFALLCRALYGKCDKNVRKRLIDLMTWRAEVSLFFQRFLWEEDLLKICEAESNRRAHFRSSAIYDSLSQTFTKNDVEMALIDAGKRTRAHKIIRIWRDGNLIKEIGKFKYKKLHKS